MHPVIRLVCFMMLSLALAVGGWLHLLLGALVAAVLFARAGAEAWAAWVPTVEGLALGALRIAALALMVVTAGLLLHFTPREQLFAALHWLTAPLGLFGVSRERVAVRVALTLAAVAEVRSEVQEMAPREERPHTRWTHKKKRVASL